MNASEFIKQEWIELIGEEEFNKIEITKDGWLEVNHSDFHFKYNRSINGDWQGKGYDPFRRGIQEIPDKLFIRPKILNNWEYNNGWIKIESEEDLPKEEYGEYHVYSENKMYSIEPKNQGIEPFWLNDKSKSQEWLDNFSHYQPIKKPKPPMY